MIDLACLPIISKAGTQSSNQPIVSISGLQRQSPAVGTPLALIELGNDWLAKNSWEQQTLVVLSSEIKEAFFVAQTLSNQHVCNRGGFFCLRSLHIHEQCGLDAAADRID